LYYSLTGRNNKKNYIKPEMSRFTQIMRSSFEEHQYYTILSSGIPVHGSPPIAIEGVLGEHLAVNNDDMF